MSFDLDGFMAARQHDSDHALLLACLAEMESGTSGRRSPMEEIMDRHAVFTIVIGCNGTGQSAWKRVSYDRLPRQYLDHDSIAGSIGTNARHRAG